MTAYLFSLTPTFTQGLLLGQISIFVLLFLVLKYLFLETSPAQSAFRPPALNVPEARRTTVLPDVKIPPLPAGLESAEWFNVILQHIAQAYRRELRNNLDGPSGDEATRVRVEGWINERRGASLLDVIDVHSVNIGTAAPKLVSARVLTDSSSGVSGIECAIAYTDSVSVSLSTSLLFHYPTPSFARLPVSLTMSLTLFSAKITITPPLLSDPTPCLTLTLDPDFVLDAKTTSLLGSRAKLSDVPKVHEMISQRIRSTLAARGTWKVLLPGVRTKDVIDRLEKKQ